MKNQRSNFIPLPTKPAKSTPKPLARPFGTRKSTSSQTERVVLVKEENLSFYPSSRFGHNDGGMRRDYVKAVTYINSCHKFINTIIEKNNLDKNNVFLLPMIPNFVPLFPYLTGKRASKRKEQESETKKIAEQKGNKTKKNDERKSRSSFGVVKKEEAHVDPVPVGDFEKIAEPQQEKNEKLTTQMTDMVKEEIHHFLTTLQEDINKASRKSRTEVSQAKCKNLDIVKNRLQQLSKICSLQKNIASTPHIKPEPLPQTKYVSEDHSTILSDTDCEENRLNKQSHLMRIPSFNEDLSFSSLTSESSDIKTDSDLEINAT